MCFRSENFGRLLVTSSEIKYQTLSDFDVGAVLHKARDEELCQGLLPLLVGE